MKEKLHQRNKILIILLFQVTFLTLYSQSFNENSTTFSSNSMGYNNVNVDLFRGKQDIEVPIYQYKSRSLNLPVYIKYNPVDYGETDMQYHPGFLGLGWNLMVGGAINRVVNDIPDESPGVLGKMNGNLSNFKTTFDPFSLVKDPITNLLDKDGYEVGEDEFYFNFCGYSGKFFFYRGVWKVMSNTN